MSGEAAAGLEVESGANAAAAAAAAAMRTQKKVVVQGWELEYGEIRREKSSSSPA